MAWQHRRMAASCNKLESNNYYGVLAGDPLTQSGNGCHSQLDNGSWLHARSV